MSERSSDCESKSSRGTKRNFMPQRNPQSSSVGAKKPANYPNTGRRASQSVVLLVAVPKSSNSMHAHRHSRPLPSGKLALEDRAAQVGPKWGQLARRRRVRPGCGSWAHSARRNSDLIIRRRAEAPEGRASKPKSEWLDWARGQMGGERRGLRRSNVNTAPPEEVGLARAACASARTLVLAGPRGVRLSARSARCSAH